MPKKFERKCGWCGRSFNHWRSHWNHEKKCRNESPATEAAVFAGFTDADAEKEERVHSELDAKARTQRGEG
jgi:hypothetical protein